MSGEFARYQVLPIDVSAMTRWVSKRTSVTSGWMVFTYLMPVTELPDGVAPQCLNTSFTINADIDVPQGGGKGSIVAEGAGLAASRQYRCEIRLPRAGTGRNKTEATE